MKHPVHRPQPCLLLIWRGLWHHLVPNTLDTNTNSTSPRMSFSFPSRADAPRAAPSFASSFSIGSQPTSSSLFAGASTVTPKAAPARAPAASTAAPTAAPHAAYLADKRASSIGIPESVLRLLKRFPCFMLMVRLLAITGALRLPLAQMASKKHLAFTKA